MKYFKHLDMTPAEGGYIISYDVCVKNADDAYDGMRHVGRRKIVATSSEDAIKKFDKIANSKNYIENKPAAKEITAKG